MKLKFFFLLLLCGIMRLQAQTYPQSNIFLVSKTDPETVVHSDNKKYSGCWGWYQASKNKEYALVGSVAGTYFMDISAPATPTVCDYVPGRSVSTWREIKTYQNYAYVVSDVTSPNSFQIIDMQYLPDSVHVVHDDTTLLINSHALWIDGDKLYCSAVKPPSGGGGHTIGVYSLATPTAPVLLRGLEQDDASINVVHDMFVRKDTVYVSAGYQGLHVYKFTNLNTFVGLGSLVGYTQSGYNHSSYITPNGKSLVFCDEVPQGVSIKVADVSNLSNISLSALMKPNNFVEFVGHNPYVTSDRWAFVSCYQDGLILYDISTPTAPVMAGYFDTHNQGGANTGNYGGTSYRGNWGAYPFYPSGLVLACDMQNGVFILDPKTVVGAEEQKKDNLLVTVFPNPSSGKIYLTVKNANIKEFSIEIKNMLGQVIFEQKEENQQNGLYISKTINTSGFAAGAYQLTVTGGGKKYQQKLIISE